MLQKDPHPFYGFGCRIFFTWCGLLILLLFYPNYLPTYLPKGCKKRRILGLFLKYTKLALDPSSPPESRSALSLAKDPIEALIPRFISTTCIFLREIHMKNECSVERRGVRFFRSQMVNTCLFFVLSKLDTLVFQRKPMAKVFPNKRKTINEPKSRNHCQDF